MRWEKVERIEADPGIPVDAAHVMIRLRDGAVVDLVETAATGSLRRPMTNDALRAKFDVLARYGCPAIDSGRLATAIAGLADAADAGVLMAYARPPGDHPQHSIQEGSTT